MYWGHRKATLHIAFIDKAENGDREDLQSPPQCAGVSVVWDTDLMSTNILSISILLEEVRRSTSQVDWPVDRL